jgi:hypothetical protein
MDAANHTSNNAEHRQRRVLQLVADVLFGNEDSAPGRSVLRLLAFVWGMIGFGLVSLLVPAIALAISGNFPQAFTLIGVGLFIAGAATAFGSMFGFLFGIPKSSLIQSTKETQRLGDEPEYVPNTNLEAISDWLTKVIVGVGLVQAREVIGWVDQVGRIAGVAMGGTEVMRVVATSLLVHNVLMGFFQGFLVAYLYLPKVFAAARRSAAPQAAPLPLPLPSGVDDAAGWTRP